jgi:cation diffusion facilitator family transporter
MHRHLHEHGGVDPAIVTTAEGIRAVTWSFFGLAVTAAFQALVVAWSGSVALLADTLHNLGDAATAVPLWIAFRLARRPPSQRFPYGLGRTEDLAGAVIVGLILASAIVAGYQAIDRLRHPQSIEALGAVAAASLLGFFGNELVAVFRTRVGRRIGSEALVADGRHARADAWTSLAVLAGALGVWAGYPTADAIAGLLVTAAILGTVWESGRTIFTRMLDGVEPSLLSEVRQAAAHAAGVRAVTEVRARWVGHWLRAEVNVAVDDHLSVAEGHRIATEVREALLHHLPHLGDAIVHVDPVGEAGERFHQIAAHAHDGVPLHPH